MSQVSRPMQVALLATLLFAVVWFVALRPKSSTDGGAPAPTAQEAPAAPGTEGLTGAIDEAHDTVAEANGEGTADAGSAAGGAAAPAAGSQGGAVARGPASPAARRALVSLPPPVRTALRRHKALALAFVDPQTADARGVEQELRHVSRFAGRAVVLSAPISQLSRYGAITREVEVTVAPTVVIVAPDRTATTIVGFADRAEIEQRLADALVAHRR